MLARNYLKKIENLHPYQTLLYLGMLSSGIIFLFLAIAFILIQQPDQLNLAYFKMPLSFLASSIVMVVSGVFVGKLSLYYRQEKIKELKNTLFLTLALGLVFTFLQLLGWRELTLSGLDFTGIPSGSFLYVLTGIHILHLLGAMVYGAVLFAQFHKVEKDMLKTLLVMVNPYERMKLRLFTLYWYFMDGVWLVLFLLFFISFN